ncbi:MAG: ChaN family lipoprotein [Vicinamibacterales bacterium]
MLSILPLALVLLQTPLTPPIQTATYVPNRVFDTAAGKFIDFESMVSSLTAAAVVFVGEQHDDPNTHRLELAILEGFRRRNVMPLVSLEMFERDVHGALADYLEGRTGEEATLTVVRPWPRYVTDYRPLVELARDQRWSVVAANVPRRIASLVAKSGRDGLEVLSDSDRALVARDLQCPLDTYFDRFAATMSDHPGGTQTPEQQRATTERYYLSQCVKDETMADSIAASYSSRLKDSGPVVHYNGAFHSDFSLGTAARTMRRLPGKRVVVVSMLPVSDLDALSPTGEDLKRAQFLVYTVK